MSEAQAAQIPPAMPGAINPDDPADSRRLERWACQARAFAAGLAAETCLTFDEAAYAIASAPNDMLPGLDHPVGWVMLGGYVQALLGVEAVTVMPSVH